MGIRRLPVLGGKIIFKNPQNRWGPASASRWGSIDQIGCGGGAGFEPATPENHGATRYLLALTAELPANDQQLLVAHHRRRILLST